MVMEFLNLASTIVSLRAIFWLYASKDGSGAPLADLLDLAVLFIVNYCVYVMIKYVFVCIYSIFITSSCPLQNCNDTQSDKLNDILLLEKIDGFLMFIQKEGKYQKTFLK